PDAPVGHGLEVRRAPGVEEGAEIRDRLDPVEVPFVVLDHEGDGAERHAHLREVLLEVLERLEVVVAPVDMRVGDEHHPVGAPEDQLPGRLVEHLPRHGVELQARGEALDLTDVDGQEIEEQRPVGLGLERDYLPSLLLDRPVVDELDGGGLATVSRTVIDDFAADLAAGVVDEGHTAHSWSKVYVVGADPARATHPTFGGYRRP